MNVNKVEFQKRDSGITWITFKGEDGIEVYPLNSRDAAALRNFLNSPEFGELKIKDNTPPVVERANYCGRLGHGFYYSSKKCPDCPS